MVFLVLLTNFRKLKKVTRVEKKHFQGSRICRRARAKQHSVRVKALLGANYQDILSTQALTVEETFGSSVMFFPTEAVYMRLSLTPSAQDEKVNLLWLVVDGSRTIEREE